MCTPQRSNSSHPWTPSGVGVGVVGASPRPPRQPPPTMKAPSSYFFLESGLHHTQNTLHECMRIVFLAEPKVVRSHGLELGAGLLDHHHPQNYYKTWRAPLGHFGAHQWGQNGGHGRCSYLRGLVVDGWHAAIQCNRLALLLHPPKRLRQVVHRAWSFEKKPCIVFGKEPCEFSLKILDAHSELEMISGLMTLQLLLFNRMPKSRFKDHVNVKTLLVRFFLYYITEGAGLRFAGAAKCTSQCSESHALTRNSLPACCY